MSQVFVPHNAAGARIATTTSSSNTTFTNTGNCNCLAVSADAYDQVTVHIRIGTSSQTAVTTDLAITGAGGTYYIGIGPDDDNVGAIAASGTPTICIQPGHVNVGR